MVLASTRCNGIFDLGGFTWKMDFYGFESEWTYNYTIMGAYAKYLLSQNNLKPYVKGGLGYFTGDADVKTSYMSEESTETAKIDAGIGFLIGGGVEFNKNFFAEFNYNIVSRKSGEVSSMDEDFDLYSISSEDESDDSFGMNTWSIKVGYRFAF